MYGNSASQNTQQNVRSALWLEAKISRQYLAHPSWDTWDDIFYIHVMCAETVTLSAHLKQYIRKSYTMGHDYADLILDT